MARAQNKWYSWGAAKRPRLQAMSDCHINSYGSVGVSTVGHCTGITFDLKREIESGPNAGYTEALSVELDGEELERLYKFYQEMQARYPKTPKKA